MVCIHLNWVIIFLFQNKFLSSFFLGFQVHLNILSKGSLWHSQIFQKLSDLCLRTTVSLLLVWSCWSFDYSVYGDHLLILCRLALLFNIIDEVFNGLFIDPNWFFIILSSWRSEINHQIFIIQVCNNRCILKIWTIIEAILIRFAYRCLLFY